jgi:hypothetical protein
MAVQTCAEVDPRLAQVATDHEVACHVVAAEVHQELAADVGA